MLPQQHHLHHASAPFIAVPIGGSGSGAYPSTTAPPATLDALAAQQLSSPWHHSLMTTFHHHQHQFHQPSPHHAYHPHGSSGGQLPVSLPAHHASTLHHAQTFHLMPTYGAYTVSPYPQHHEYMAWGSAEKQREGERRSQHTDAATMQIAPQPTASFNHHTFVDAATVVRLEHYHHHHHHHHQQQQHYHPSSAASPLNVVPHGVPSFPMHDGTSSLPTVGGFHVPSVLTAAAVSPPLQQLPLLSDDSSSAPPPFTAQSSAARAAASRPATASPGTLRWSDSRQKRPAKPVEVPPAAPGDSEPGPRQVIVNYLATNIDSEGLGCLFSQYGPIDSVRVVTDGPNGQSRGYGFVYFKSHADAVQAVADASGRVLLGKRVRASYAVPQRNLMTFLELGGIPVSEEAKRMVAAQLEQQQGNGAPAAASQPPPPQ